jgi:hypothetical protein
MPQAWYEFQRKTITIDSILTPRVPLSICSSNLADRRGLALNQIELNATKRRLVILGTKYDKQNNQSKMRDNYCPHLNPLHQETLLSLQLTYELLWMALKVTLTGHPFLQKIGKGQAIPWQAIPYTTGYTNLL